MTQAGYVHGLETGLETIPPVSRFEPAPDTERAGFDGMLVGLTLGTFTLPQAPSMRETLVEVLRLAGLPVLVTDACVGVVHDPQTLGICTIGADDEYTWHMPPGRRYGQSLAERMAEHRRDTIARTIRDIAFERLTMEQVLAEPFDDTPSGACRRAVVVAAWWQARLDEGHTPETAHFLLSLIAHPSTMATFA